MPVVPVVPVMSAVLVAESSNRGAAYDLVLLLHVLSALAGFGAVAVAGVHALLLRRPGPPGEAVVRYYRPGVNWAGRILFVVPVLGLTLVAMSRGAWSFSDGWLMAGLMLWVVAAFGAELVLWPAERRLQDLVAEDPVTVAGSRALCLQVAGVASAELLIFVVATVVMTAKP